MNVISDSLLEPGALVRIHESTRILHAHRIARIVSSQEVRTETQHFTRVTYRYTVSPVWNELFPQRQVTPFEVAGNVLVNTTLPRLQDTGWPVAAESLASLGMLFLPNPTTRLSEITVAQRTNAYFGYTSVEAPTYHNYEAGDELFRRLDTILQAAPR